MNEEDKIDLDKLDKAIDDLIEAIQALLAVEVTAAEKSAALIANLEDQYRDELIALLEDEI